MNAFKSFIKLFFLLLIINCIPAITAFADDTSNSQEINSMQLQSSNSNILIDQKSEINSLFITSDNSKQYGRTYIESSEDHSLTADGYVELKNNSGQTLKDGKVSIKGRGNSTWYPEKKPYQIKFDKKVDLLSDDKDDSAKTWLLLANAYDDTLIKNYVAYQTAYDVGLNESPECQFVDLYYDNEYRGLYLLCEKVQINKNRINIQENEPEATDSTKTEQAKNSYNYTFQYNTNLKDDSIIDSGYLLEIDNPGYKEELSWFESSIGHVVVKSPEFASYKQMKYISEYFEAAIKETSNIDGNAAKYFDLESLTKYFLVNEFAKNSDYMRYSSTYFYKDKGQVLHAGPVWDFDLAFGMHGYEGYGEYIDYTGLTDPERTFFVCNKQFIRSVETYLPDFISTVSKWTDDTIGILNLTNSMRNSIQNDEDLWKNKKPGSVIRFNFNNHFEAINQLNSWISQRINWMQSDLLNELYTLQSQKIKSNTTKLNRIWGNVALDTMNEIVRVTNFKNTDKVILVTCEGYHDALTASGLAGLLDCPILMTNRNFLSNQTSELLKKFKPNHIIVCGGTAAITENVAQEAIKISGAKKYDRCWGATAVETAIDIYEKGYQLSGKHWANTSFLCTSQGYHDALAASPISYALHIPILLTNDLNTISNETLQTLKSDKLNAVYILGGTAAVSQNVENVLRSNNIAISSRLWGSTAVETAIEISKYGVNRGLSVNNSGIATINGHWDALSGGIMCGVNRSLLLIVPDNYNANLQFYLKSIANRMIQLNIFGGVKAVTEIVEKRIYQYVN